MQSRVPLGPGKFHVVVLVSFVTDIKLSVGAEIYFSSLWFVSLDYIALLLLIYDSPLPPHLLCKIVKQF